MSAKDVLALMHAFAIKTRSGSVDLRQFVASLPKGEAQPGDIEAAVTELAGTGALVVTAEGGKPRFAQLPDYPLVALVDLYRQLSVDPQRPFPRAETAPARIPAGELTAADVKGQLGVLLQESLPEAKGIVNLQFPEGVDPLIVPQRCIGTDLIDAATVKISRYLQEGKNAAYAESKLVGALRGSEAAVRAAMEDASTRPKKAAATVLSPTDFNFRFWTHLSNLVLQDIRAKADRTDLDQGACQSAYIIGYTVFHKKGTVQKEQDWAVDRKSLEVQVRRAPFVFGFQDLFALKDARGATYISKHSQEFITTFLKEKTKRSGAESIPYLVRVHAAAQKKDYFIQKDLLVPVFLKKLGEAAEELRTIYLDGWTEEMRQERTPPVSTNDAAFRKDVEQRVKQGYPLLAAMANGALLFVAGEETAISDDVKKELRKCFAVENILRPFDELLGLSRTGLLKDARMFLPWWMTVPLLGGIVRVLRRMFRGRRTVIAGPVMQQSAARAAAGETMKVAKVASADVPQDAANKENLVRFRRSVASLIAHYVPAGRTIDATLAELAEKWNPLYSPEQKRNLVEDVNALVRDFLRPIRRSFLVRPPDLKRIHALAEQLSGSKSLVQIKKRDLLMRYIELYMIRCLQVKQL
jgi:hypothetical protein